MCEILYGNSHNPDLQLFMVRDKLLIDYFFSLLSMDDPE